MLRRMLALAVLSSFLISCASWFSSDSTSKEQDSPTVGSKDSSDFLFGQAADTPSDVKEDNGVAPAVAKPNSSAAAK
jgi:hypothetical protein